VPDLKSILDAAPAANEVRAEAWDAFHLASSPEDFKSRFDKLKLPDTVKADLWDLKFQGPGTGERQPGQLTPGNIDLTKRPVVKNPDGSFSTVRSMSFNDKGREVLIPTVVGGKVVSDQEAISHYRKTGEHLGIFDTPQNATAYAQGLHESQAQMYAPQQRLGPGGAAVNGLVMQEQSLLDTPLVSLPRPPEATTTAGKLARGGATGLMEAGEGLITPRNIGIVGGLGLLNAAQLIPGSQMVTVPLAQSANATASTYFAAQLATSAIEQVPEFAHAVERRDPEQAARILTGVGVNAWLARAAANHAVQSVARPVALRMGYPVAPEIDPAAAKQLQRTYSPESADPAAMPPGETVAEQRRTRQAIEQNAAEARRRGVQPAAPVEEAPARENRAQRRGAVMPPETGTAEEPATLVDPRLREIAGNLDLGEYDKLSEADKAVVRRLRDEQPSAPEEPRAQEHAAEPAGEAEERPEEDLGHKPEGTPEQHGLLERIAAAGAESDEWLRKNGITSGESVSANRFGDPEVIYHMARSIAGDLAGGALTVKRVAAELRAKFGEAAGEAAEAVYGKLKEIHAEAGFARPEQGRRGERETSSLGRMVAGIAPRDSSEPANAVTMMRRAQEVAQLDPAVKAVTNSHARGMWNAPGGDEAGRPEFSSQFEVTLPEENEQSINRIAREVIRAARRHKQDDAFVARTIPDSTESTEYARPGLSVYFKKPLGEQEAWAIIDSIRTENIGGFTLFGGPGSAPGEYVGMRFIYMPEYVFDPAKIARMSDAEVEKLVQESKAKARSDMNRIVAQLEQDGKVGHAMVEHYDVLNANKEDYGRLIEQLGQKNPAGREAGLASPDGGRGLWRRPVSASVKERALARSGGPAVAEEAGPGSGDAGPAEAPAAEAPAVEKPQVKPEESALDRAEKRIRARIDKRSKDLAQGKTLSAGPGLAVEQMADYAALGAVKIAKGAVKFDAWSREMVADLGEEIKPHLSKIWLRAKQIHAEGGGDIPRTAVATAAAKREPLVTSPSYDETKPNVLARVAPGVRDAMEARLEDFEKRNPERRAVTFADVREQARDLDPELVKQLDLKKLKAGETLDPAVRFAARETLNGLNQEIVEKRKQFSERSGAMLPDERKQEMRKLEDMERDARRLVDVLIPTRSQDGRNLAYHRMVAEGSFDVTYWLSRARRAMAIPEGVDLPEETTKGIQEATAKGAEADAKAVRTAKRKQAQREAEAEARKEAQRGEEQDREFVVEQKYKELVGRLKRAIAGEETQTVDPVTPEEREAWEREPEILKLRAQLARIREEKAGQARLDVKREQIVEQKRKQFIAQLRRQAEGKLVSVDPVSDAERAMWEQDPEVLGLRAKIAANRAPKTAPTTAEKQARYKQRVLELIGQKMAGEETKRAPSKWELTPEERAQVDADPEVRQARIDLAKRMAKLEKTGWLDAITAYRRAGLLTGPRTHMRNLGGNAAFQVLEEVERVPSVVADAALSIFTGRRTVQAPSARAVASASYEAATRGVREAGQIMREGATEEQLAQMDVPKEINTGLRVFDKAVNLVFRSMSAADRVFKVYAIERSLQEQMKLAKVDTPTDAMRARAVADADFATFNNENMFARGLSRFKAELRTNGDAGKLAAFGIDLVVPFARTPANVVARVIDYTLPGGAGRWAGAVVRAFREGGITPEIQRSLAQAIGRGSTGSALMYLGWRLAKGGVMTGVTPEERGQRAVDEAAGRLYGAILLDGRWHKIDAFSPVGNLLVLGATLHREGTSRGNAGAIAFAAAKTVMEQPMLKGMSLLSDTISDPARSASKFLGDMAGSFVPTAVADAAAIADSKRRDSRAESFGETAGKSVAMRVPGLRNTLPERRDVLGRVQEQERLTALSPTIATRAKEADDPVLREMTAVRASMDYGRKREGESQGDYAIRMEAIGDAVHRKVERLIATGAYVNADREERKELIQQAIAQVRGKAALAVRARMWPQMDAAGKREFLERRLR
jgi:hypothetical protein